MLHGNFLGKPAFVVEVDNYGVCPSMTGFGPGFVLRIGFLVILPVRHFLANVLNSVFRGR